MPQTTDLSPLAPIYEAGEKFRQRVNALDEAAGRQMAKRYVQALDEIRPKLTALERRAAAAVAKGQTLTKGQMTRWWRQAKLEQQILTSLGRVSQQDFAELIASGQAEAISLGQRHAKGMVDVALPEGIDTKVLARAGLEWNALPDEALANLVGTMGNGAPLGELLGELPLQTAQAMERSLTTGLVRGLSPREIARQLQNAEGLGLTRALRISRTEILRSYRESTRATYEENSDIVKGYRRLAARDARTCMACIATDGKFYELDEPLPAHVNCRCTTIPETVTHEDLGLDAPEAQATEPSAAEWFNDLPPETQREMMGLRAYEEFAAGKVKLGDFVATSSHPAWGKAEHVASLRRMGITRTRRPRPVRKSDVVWDLSEEQLAWSETKKFASPRYVVGKWSAFMTGAGVSRQVRTFARKMLAGKAKATGVYKGIDLAGTTVRIMREMNAGKRYAKLYRGIHISGEKMQKARGDWLQEGKTFDFLPSSFTKDKDLGTHFSMEAGPQRSVVLELRGGKGWDIAKWSKFPGEQEVIGGGRVVIKSITEVTELSAFAKKRGVPLPSVKGQKPDLQGHLHVILEQVP